MDLSSTWMSFYQSAPRQLVALSRYLQGQSMQQLKQRHGHRELRLHFEPYMSLLALKERRVTELADELSLTKQACNQVADKLQDLGYVRRQSDASDGRAKLLGLTAKGKQLIEDGIHTARVLDEECGKHLSPGQLQQLRDALRVLSGQSVGDALLMLLPRLGDRSHRAFLQRLIEKDARLKPSHLECFTLIGGCDGQLKRIAQLQEVSLPAVQQLAKDLEQWGYVTFDEHKKLQLTRAGEKLLADAIAADEALAQHWARQLGASSFEAFRINLAALYEALALPQKMLGQLDAVQQLADQLRRELGAGELQRLVGLLKA